MLGCSCVSQEFKDGNKKNVPAQWYEGDYVIDSLPGIFLSKTNKELIGKAKGEKIIVAIMDQQVDINHEDLKGNIYTNKNEIPENGIDDDNNGYVDDIHGWNFLGTKYDGRVLFGKPQIFRMLNKYEDEYGDKNIEEIDQDKIKEFNRLKKLYEDYISGTESAVESSRKRNELLQAGLKKFNDIFDSKNRIDTIKINNIVPKSEEEKEILDYLKNIYEKYKYTPQLVNTIYLNNKDYLRFTLNKKRNDRDSIWMRNGIGGNGNLKVGLDRQTHGTQVAGIIAATRNNGIGINGVSNNIELMILSMQPIGDAHTDDIAAAIRYAVDNGAKVINYSAGPSLMMDEYKVIEALKYAEENDVLYIGSAGNNGEDTDIPKNFKYPIDQDSLGNEYLTNLIRVGASNKYATEKLKFSRSNFGKKSVDLFAPGHKMKTTQSIDNGYFTLSGTSLSSALVAGSAALLKSYFPNLSAQEIKEILMESGTKIDWDVNVGGEKIPFSELSKSGKLLNVYNAFKMSEIRSAEKLKKVQH